MEVCKVKSFAVGYIDIDSILLEPAVSETFYFKNDAGASVIIIFIGSPNVLMQY